MLHSLLYSPLIYILYFGFAVHLLKEVRPSINDFLADFLSETWKLVSRLFMSSRLDSTPSSYKTNTYTLFNGHLSCEVGCAVYIFMLNLCMYRQCCFYLCNFRKTELNFEFFKPKMNASSSIFLLSLLRLANVVDQISQYILVIYSLPVKSFTSNQRFNWISFAGVVNIEVHLKRKCPHYV